MPGRNKLRLIACAFLGTATLYAAAPPADLSATAPVQTMVCLGWKASKGVTRYNVYRGARADGESLLKSVDGAFFTDFTDAEGTTFFYKVTAVDGGGESGKSSEVSITTKPPATTSLTATAGDDKVTLKWASCKGATSYRIYRVSYYDAATFLTTDTSFIDTNVIGGRTYCYQLAPINLSGEQAETGPSASATPRGKPAPQFKPAAPAKTPADEPGIALEPKSAAARAFHGPVTAAVPGEEIQEYQASIPNLNRPIRAVFLYSMVDIELPRLKALAASCNAMIIGFGPFKFQGQIYTTPDDTGHPILTMDYRWTPESTRRVLAVLAQASTRFAHPEIQNAPVVFYGFSEGTDNVDLIAAQPEFIHRLLAVVQLHELDEDRYNPLSQMLAAPHLFLSSFGGDIYSSLFGGMEDAPSFTHDAFARALATNQGAPLTVVNHVGQPHGGDPDSAFITLWLRSVLNRRLPAAPSMTTQTVLPGWRNAPGWLGTYDLAKDVHTPPWDDDQRMENVVIAPREAYKDVRSFTWLPDKETAEIWKQYAESGSMPIAR